MFKTHEVSATVNSYVTVMGRIKAKRETDVQEHLREAALTRYRYVREAMVCVARFVKPRRPPTPQA